MLGRKRRYVKLYKLKLECLRKEQPLDDEIVLELDQIEKVSDIEDILGYRSAAEHELQHVAAEGTTLVKEIEDAASNKKAEKRLQTDPATWPIMIFRVC
ncbi:hypothetical protein Lser_V15G00390 [Lactuca serriola]